MLRKYDNFFNDETTYLHGTTTVAIVNHTTRTIKVPKSIPYEIAKSLYQIIQTQPDYTVKELDNDKS